MTYLWRIPDNYPDKLIGIYQRNISRDSYEFDSGKYLEETGEQIVFKFKRALAELSGLGCLCNTTLIPLVSPELGEFLSANSQDEIQLFAAKVIAKDGETDRYSFLNIINSVDCVDREKSDIRVSGNVGGIDLERIEHLVHKPKCMKKLAIARDLKEKGHLVVSDGLAEKLNGLKMPGISLMRPEDVYP